MKKIETFKAASVEELGDMAAQGHAYHLRTIFDDLPHNARVYYQEPPAEFDIRGIATKSSFINQLGRVLGLGLLYPACSMQASRLTSSCKHEPLLTSRCPL
jgi:hypothetical protein